PHLRALLAERGPKRRLRRRPGGRPGFARASVSTRPAAPHLRALLAERGPRRRLRRRPGGRPGFARASVSTRPAAAPLPALLAERRIRDRLQRLGQAPRLLRQAGEALARG